MRCDIYVFIRTFWKGVQRGSSLRVGRLMVHSGVELREGMGRGDPVVECSWRVESNAW